MNDSAVSGAIQSVEETIVTILLSLSRWLLDVIRQLDRQVESLCKRKTPGVMHRCVAKRAPSRGAKSRWQ